MCKRIELNRIKIVIHTQSGLAFYYKSCILEFEFHLQHFECNDDVISE